MGKWRAVVLTLVHVAIAVHIVLWLIAGTTLSPVEPSESMQTLEFGIVNAGFVLFALAILSTLIFGRYFCGWACHVVALQDACAWLMKKLGVHPKPFRTRWLVLAPVALAFYMFVWPNFKRFLVFPALDAVGWASPIWLKPVPQLHGFETEFMVEDFWATFPPWYIAIPFLFVCGFAAVYFLGAKGFCTYGCPYGGFFGPADRVAPGRIRVTDACQHCGHCTAVCTSNVRVHQEVHDYGMVIDAGCMKCMDCVSACPNDALYFGFGAPAIGAKPRTEKPKKRSVKYDLTVRAEVAVGVVGLLLFFGFRGMANMVPMLMAVGMAGIGAFLAWKLWCVLTTPNVRLQSLKLRHKGKLCAWGVVTLVVVPLILLAGAWGVVMNGARWHAGVQHDYLGVPVSITGQPDYRPRAEDLMRARRVLDSVTLLERFGWGADASEHREAAYAALVAGEMGRAIEEIRAVILEGDPDGDLVVQMAQLMAIDGATPESVRTELESALELHADLHLARREITRLALVAGAPMDDAMRHWDEAIEEAPEDAPLRVAAAGVDLALGRASVAAERLAGIDAGSLSRGELITLGRMRAQLGDLAAGVEALEASLERTRDPSLRLGVAEAMLAINQPERAVEVARESVGGRRATGAALFRASGVAFRASEPEDAAAWLDRAAIAGDLTPVLRADIGWALFSTGQEQRGIELMNEAVFTTADEPWWTAMTVAERMVNIGGVPGVPPELPESAIATFRAATERSGVPAAWNSYAGLMTRVGDLDEAEAATQKASELLGGGS